MTGDRGGETPWRSPPTARGRAVPRPPTASVAIRSCQSAGWDRGTCATMHVYRGVKARVGSECSRAGSTGAACVALGPHGDQCDELRHLVRQHDKRHQDKRDHDQLANRRRRTDVAIPAHDTNDTRHGSVVNKLPRMTASPVHRWCHSHPTVLRETVMKYRESPCTTCHRRLLTVRC